MNKMMFYIANWKMNFNIQESIKYLEIFSNYFKSNDKIEVVFCPTYTSLAGLINNNILSLVKYGTQNVSYEESGAHTGEISIKMLLELSWQYCIVGHSERRTLYSETNRNINQKINLLLRNNIIPILCVGETVEERKSNNSNNIVTHQLSSCLKEVNLEENKILIAYEPVWAIGSGDNATTSDISLMNKTIINHMNTLGYNNDQFYILYGGSVDISNILDLKLAEYLNGFLIGGASLDPINFWNIINK